MGVGCSLAERSIHTSASFRTGWTSGDENVPSELWWVLLPSDELRVNVRGQVLGKPATERRLWQNPGELGRYIAIGEELHCGDAPDAVALGEFRVRVHVDLDEPPRAAALSRDLLDCWAEYAARSAPGCPEVDYHRLAPARLDYVLFEVSHLVSQEG